MAYLLKQLLGAVEHPSGYFLRLYFSHSARRLLQWSNLGPHAEQLPWHYRHAAKWVRANPEALDREVGPDPKRLYTAVRGRATAGPVVGVPPAVWTTVQTAGLDNGLKELNWLCLHRALPVRSLMNRHSLAMCPRVGCSEEETVRHIMWDCRFAGVVWARAERLVTRAGGDIRLSWEKVERGVGRVAGGVRSRFLLWLVVSLVKRGLWEARVDLVRRNREWGVEGVIRRVEGDIRRRVWREMRKWGQHAALERWKGGLGLI